MGYDTPFGSHPHGPHPLDTPHHMDVLHRLHHPHDTPHHRGFSPPQPPVLNEMSAAFNKKQQLEKQNFDRFIMGMNSGGQQQTYQMTHTGMSSRGMSVGTGVYKGGSGMSSHGMECSTDASSPRTQG